MAFWNRDGSGPTSSAPHPVNPSGHDSSASARVSAGSTEPAAPVAAHVPAVRQSLGRETTVTGKLSFHAPTRIDGVLHGEVRASDLLVVGEEGKVDGAVRAQQLLVLGEVRGEVHVEGRTEIGATGKLRGTLISEHLVVHPGAFLEGDCKIGPK